MAPTKAKVRKTKGLATLAPQAKRTWKAGNKRLALATIVQCQHQIDAKEMAVTVEQDVMQKLDSLVKAMMDLSRQVKATENCQRDGGLHPVVALPPFRQRVRRQETPDMDQDVAEEVRWCVEKRLRELPAYHEAITDEDHTSEEEQPAPMRKKSLKSGMH